MEFRTPDVIPIQVHPSPGGLFEHGPKLLDLLKSCPNDFGDPEGLRMPDPPSEEFDGDGAYHAVRTDPWDVTWEYRIYGIWGHPLRRPLDDLDKLATYRAPAPPRAGDPGWESAKAEAAKHRETRYLVGNGDMLWERMHFLRGYEEVMTEIMLDTPEIHRIADMISTYMDGCVRYCLDLEVDAVIFGDDFGTQLAPIFPPRIWREFFKSRYERIVKPIRQSGTAIHFHSCGQIGPYLADFAELGVGAVWPQLPLYDQRELAAMCRDLGLAVLLHPDRGELLQRGTPDQVRRYLDDLLEAFRTRDGGSWLYVEIDPGFRWDTTVALVEYCKALR